MLNRNRPARPPPARRPSYTRGPRCAAWRGAAFAMARRVPALRARILDAMNGAHLVHPGGDDLDLRRVGAGGREDRKAAADGGELHVGMQMDERLRLDTTRAEQLVGDHPE